MKFILPVPDHHIPRSIAAYYNRNTRLFLKFFGSGIQVAAIHRQIWGPGVKTSQESFEYLNDLVVQQIKDGFSKKKGFLLDLGCGIGGTTTWAASKLSLKTIGVTLSEIQARMAVQRAIGLGLVDITDFIQGDFENLPFTEAFQGAWAIEAFAHHTDPQLFFQSVNNVLVPGARLVIADDFLGTREPQDKTAAEWVYTFQKEWHLPGLMTMDATTEFAERNGFRMVNKIDLSRYLRLIPGWLIQLAFKLLKTPLPFVYWKSLRGSTALQQCIRKGYTRYGLIVFEKTGRQIPGTFRMPYRER